MLRQPSNHQLQTSYTNLFFLWDAVSSANSYDMQYSTDSTFATYFSVNTSTTYTHVNTLLRNTTYYWRVRARNSNGVSPWSAIWDFTTDKEYRYNHFSASSCDSYTLNGITYTTSGLYHIDTIPIEHGVDSVNILNLVIHNSANETLLVEACREYLWNDIIYSQSGSYSATYQTIHGCDSIVTLQLTVYNPQAQVIYDNLNSMLICENSDVTYQWIDCDNGYLPVNGEVASTFTPEISGNYAVVIVESDICTDTSDCVEVILVGINDFNQSSTISIYPNPTSGLLEIHCLLIGNSYSLKLYDVYGKFLLATKMTDSYTEIDMSSYANGIYLVKIFNEDKIISTRKVVKQ